MHSVRIHTVIEKLISFLYYIGFWHRGDKPTVSESRMKLFYCIYYSLFPISLMVGAITSEAEGHAILLVETSIGAGVLNAKLWFLIWKQDQIVGLMNRICMFSVRYDDDLTFVNKKLRGFALFATVYNAVQFITGPNLSIQPIFQSEKTLFMQIGFPLDYNNSEIALYIASFYFVPK